MVNHIAIIAQLTDLYRKSAAALAACGDEKQSVLPRHVWQDWKLCNDKIQSDRTLYTPSVADELDRLCVVMHELAQDPDRINGIPDHLKDTSSRVAMFCSQNLL